MAKDKKEKAVKPAPLTKEEKAKARDEAKAKTAADKAAKSGGKKDDKVEVLKGTVEPYVEVVTEHLLCPLTQVERLEKLEELNTTLGAINKLKAQGKAAAAEYNEQAKERMGHQKTLQNQLEEGISRPIKCDVTYDFKNKLVTRTRKDTGEVIGTRPMNDYDRTKAQENLPFQKLQEHAEGVQEKAREGAAAEPEAAPVEGDGPSED